MGIKTIKLIVNRFKSLELFMTIQIIFNPLHTLLVGSGNELKLIKRVKNVGNVNAML